MANEIGLAADLAARLPGSIDTWKVKWTGKTTDADDDAFYSLGELADAEIVVDSLDDVTSRKLQRAYGLSMRASAKLLGTHKTTMFPYLVKLTNHMQHKITNVGGVTFQGELGFGWKFDSSMDFAGRRFLEIIADRKFIIDGTAFDLADLLPETPTVDGTPDGGDELYSFDPGSSIAAGVTAIELKATGSATWETLDENANVKLVAELRTGLDRQGMSRSNNIVHVTVELDYMQTSRADLLRMSSVLTRKPDFRLTMADGMIFTFDDSLGIHLGYSSPADVDNAAFVRFNAQGAISPTAFLALIS